MQILGSYHRPAGLEALTLRSRNMYFTSYPGGSQVWVLLPRPGGRGQGHGGSERRVLGTSSRSSTIASAHSHEGCTQSCSTAYYLRSWDRDIWFSSVVRKNTPSSLFFPHLVPPPLLKFIFCSIVRLIFPEHKSIRLLPDYNLHGSHRLLNATPESSKDWFLLPLCPPPLNSKYWPSWTVAVTTG